MSAEAAPVTAALKRKTKWAIIGGVTVLLVVLAVVATFVLRSKSASTAASYSTDTVKRSTISVLVSGTGSTVIADSVTVNPEISGTVEKLYVTLGDTVSAGDKLYTISSSDVESQLLQSKASLLQSKQSKTQASSSVSQAKNQLYAANTQLIQAEQNLDELRSQPATTPGRSAKIVLAQRAVVAAKAGVSQASTSVKAANLGLQVASANLTSAQQDYDDAVTATDNTVVTAPIDGVVTALPVSVGSAVSAGTSSGSSSSGSSASGAQSSSSAGGASSGSSTGATTSSSSSSGSAITISDLSNLQVQIAVSEADVPSLKLGQKATVTFDALPSGTTTGTVSLIAPNGTTSSGVVSYDVTVVLDEQAEGLRPDMTATADIMTQVAENVLMVPSTAVKTSGDTKYVEVLGADGSLTKVTVTLGVSDDTSAEIKSGLTEGATVVVGSTTASTSSTTSSSSTGRSSGGFMMGGGPPAGGPGGN